MWTRGDADPLLRVPGSVQREQPSPTAPSQTDGGGPSPRGITPSARPVAGAPSRGGRGNLPAPDLPLADAVWPSGSATDTETAPGKNSAFPRRDTRPKLPTLRTDPPPRPTEGEARREPLRSLRPDEVRMVYQPIVDLRTGQSYAVEALARCKRPGLEQPLLLIERALQEDGIGRLGRVLREATFADCAGERIFVNIHPDELTSRWLVRPDDPICFHDHEVFLEITESAALDYYDVCMSVLHEICHRTGARLVIDDLGAGYSNLERVADLVPAVVKIDRALVTRLHTDRRRQAIVRHLVRLCEELDATVVAEGIETVEELQATRDCGAHFGQGYLLARPAFPIPDVHWPWR